MRTVIFSDSILISATRPYFWTLTLFGIVLPPNYILRTIQPTNRQWLLFLIRIVFTIYALLHWTFTGFWIAYLNKNFLNNYVRRNSLDSKTYILTIGIIIVQLIVQTVIHAQALMGHQQLRRILINVVQLESDIREHASAVCSLCAIRWRFFLHIGLWLLLLCTFIMYLYYELSPGKYTALHQVVSIFGYTLTQMKGVEYCVSVQLIHELLHLVQQQLTHLSWKLERCERLELRWDLFVQLQTNQALLSRVWHLLNQVERYFYLPVLMLFFCNGFLMTQTIHWGYINLELDDLKLRLCKFSRDSTHV
ncbi:putative gustatory receptor 98b [Zeugodacus cucurbitae]|uniref:putative gustatory receptor 98b n=1 Tax=Zeugodacus cucurbitae TaxID=28588 RepID=UPI0023D95DFE|nr:putative gustatory receptor 98b [Zeugodacus cucurbitae]